MFCVNYELPQWKHLFPFEIVGFDAVFCGVLYTWAPVSDFIPTICIVKKSIFPILCFCFISLTCLIWCISAGIEPQITQALPYVAPSKFFIPSLDDYGIHWFGVDVKLSGSFERLWYFDFYAGIWARKFRAELFENFGFVP